MSILRSEGSQRRRIGCYDYHNYMYIVTAWRKKIEGVTSPSLLSQNQYALRNGPLEIRYGRALHAPVLRARQTLCVQCLLPLSLLQQVFIIGGKKSVNKRINTKRMRTTISGLLTLRSSLFSTAIFPPSILMF